MHKMETEQDDSKNVIHLLGEELLILNLVDRALRLTEHLNCASFDFRLGWH